MSATRLLFLAPQPFFEERGTPIAVRLALDVLRKRPDLSIQLLTYHTGTPVDLPGINHLRIPLPRSFSSGGAGISVRKLICDVLFTITTFWLVARARWQGAPHQLIHAVEESVFIAWAISLISPVRYVYDMDSSLTMQLLSKWRFLRPLRKFGELLERAAIRRAEAVVPVCDSLAAIADGHGSRATHILRDISLLEQGSSNTSPPPSLRAEANLESNATVLVYIGNLERYQGIDLLIESFRLAVKSEPSLRLVIIGGSVAHQEHYRQQAVLLGLEGSIILLGSRPVEHLRHYLSQADIVVSPRCDGENTPMKIYSYLHSGTAIVATRLPTHTQVLSDAVSFLSEPNPEEFARTLIFAARHPDERKGRAARAVALAEERYTFSVFSASLNRLYDQLTSASVAGEEKPPHRAPPSSPPQP